MDYIKLSKEISYALRHKPEEYNLSLDEEGYVFINDLLNSINSKNHYSKTITIDDIYEVIRISDKKRLDINNDMIRALYGHSVETVIQKEEAIPPDVLYHGTTHKAINNIMIEGLKPMSRQYVHLSVDIDTAKLVGLRRDNDPIILTIDAKKAYEGGIKFYIGNDKIWLSEHIPSKYIHK